jgi:hypothetical protein
MKINDSCFQKSRGWVYSWPMFTQPTFTTSKALSRKLLKLLQKTHEEYRELLKIAQYFPTRVSWDVLCKHSRSPIRSWSDFLLYSRQHHIKKRRSSWAKWHISHPHAHFGCHNRVLLWATVMHSSTSYTEFRMATSSFTTETFRHVPFNSQRIVLCLLLGGRNITFIYLWY